MMVGAWFLPDPRVEILSLFLWGEWIHALLGWPSSCVVGRLWFIGISYDCLAYLAVYAHLLPLNFSIIFFIIVFLMCAQVGGPTEVLSFYDVGSGDSTEVASKYPYLLRHCSGLSLLFESQYLSHVEPLWLENEKVHRSTIWMCLVPEWFYRGKLCIKPKATRQNVWPLTVLHTDTFSLCAQGT